MKYAARTALLAVAIMVVGAGCGEGNNSISETTTTAVTSRSTVSALPPPPPAAESPTPSVSTVDPPVLEQQPAVDSPEVEAPTVEHREEVGPAPSAGAAVTVGEACSTPSSIGTDVETGADIVCVFMGPGGNVWVNSVPIVGVNNPGDPCDSSSGQASCTPEGLAIMCVQGTWVYGP